MRQPDFDIDFRRGQQGELFVQRIIQGIKDGTTEVKRDDRAAETGNLYIETECLRQDVYCSSGISETRAEIYAFVVGDLMLAVPTPMLRQILPSLRRASCDRGNHPTRGYLLPLGTLIGMMRQRAKSPKLLD